MRRYAAYDPPEYVSWEADPRILAEYSIRFESADPRRDIGSELDDDALLALYRGLLRFRLHDVALKRWVKQGTISKAWLATPLTQAARSAEVLKPPQTTLASPAAFFCLT